MDAELYARATSLFHLAVELPEPERTAFVEANCGGDLSLKDAVLDMLAMYSEGDPFSSATWARSPRKCWRTTRICRPPANLDPIVW